MARPAPPFLTACLPTYPHARLLCAGEAVGLPDGQMGNSEVGHLNMGAGRIVYQNLPRISAHMRDGDFCSITKSFQGLVDRVKERGRACI